MVDSFLEGITVVELGDRLAAGLCGGLLQRLGAYVTVVEDSTHAAQPAGDSKRLRRELFAGKNAVLVNSDNAHDLAALISLVKNADVVVTSTDRDGALKTDVRAAIASGPIVCDLTAFGETGPCAGAAYSDAMMQAFAGLMETTGSPDGPPTVSALPITECSAAVFAASGILCALRGRAITPMGQRVSVAMFDVAISMLSTFLPSHFVGSALQRIGNRHPSMSPWNAYPARDGWVLLCSASNDMWKRVCRVIGRDELAADLRFATMPDRVRNADAADAVVLPWIRTQSVNQCVEEFIAAGVPCGPVYTIEEMLADANLHARGAFARVTDPRSMSDYMVPGAVIKGSRATGKVPQGIAQNASIVALSGKSLRRSRPQPLASGNDQCAALAGVRVLEMGSYTTAPLAARNLAAFGAYVVKLEPPAGELSRASPPHIEGQSFFCTLSNSDKRCVAVDLQTEDGKALFARLLAKADVFVENMKPGALDRFGFSRERIEAINPALVYCSVSGFGAGSPLAARPAMDSTIQGMTGIMDLTRQNGTPFKTGISIADLVGGQFALLAVLAGLEYRTRTGNGQFIDLSMQEVSAWLTQLAWNPAGAAAGSRIVKCSDGYVYIADVANTSLAEADEQRCSTFTRADAVGYLDSQGLTCTPVNTVSEVAEHPQTRVRELIVQGKSRDGKSWPLLACPIRLSPLEPKVRRAIGAVGADLAEVQDDWEISASRVESKGQPA